MTAHDIASGSARHRTQFDDELLVEFPADVAPVCSNHGRQVIERPDGSTLAALAWGGPRPLLRVWRDRVPSRDISLEGTPTAPCLDAHGNAWLSVNGRVLCEGVVRGEGHLHDLCGDVLAVERPDGLHVVRGDRDVLLHDQARDARVETDDAGRVHVVYERRWSIEYRCLDGATLAVTRALELARPFGRAPCLALDAGRVIVVYLGDHIPVPPEDAAFWADKPWQRRIGMGGCIAAVVLEPDGTLARHTLAESRQFAKPRWPKRPTFEYDYPNVEVRVRLDRFGAPALSRGGDGVLQALWANVERRWIYASRWLAASFAPAVEVRGPFEQLTEPVLAPRSAASDIPFAVTTRSRVYLERLRLPPRDIASGRQIDFVQLDELSSSRGLELVVNAMARSAANPVITAGGAGSFDEAGIAGGVVRLPDGRWQADLLSKRDKGGWRGEQPAFSRDGIRFDRPGPYAEGATFTIDGVTHACSAERIYWVEDPDAAEGSRFKGLWQHDPERRRWGTLQPVFSADGAAWTTVRDRASVPVCDGVHVWRDNADVPARRFKASGNARSFCGRVCAQWTSPDGLHWHDVRDSLDVDDPFGAAPYWHESYDDGRGTGRYLVDPWAGPDDEDEIHGGVVFRDGDRWLCHYMKWTCDGHILGALASSRDGINFSRVGGGAPTLPLGAPGEWDSGRIAMHAPPQRDGDTWRQYYVGSGWKHGMEGKGRRPHPTSGNVGPYSPCQIGLAEIEAGRWAHVRVQRDVDAAEMVTIPLVLRRPHRLTLNVAGVGAPGSRVTCAISECEDQGFGFEQCDTIAADGLSVPVTWRGRGLEALGPRAVRIALRMSGCRLRLYAANLVPVR